MYADTVTASMQRAIDETERRREKQNDHNRKHNIIPIGIKRDVADIMEGARGVELKRKKKGSRRVVDKENSVNQVLNQEELEKQIGVLEKEMFEHARNLAFEEAARVRDQIEELRYQFVGAR